MPLTNRLRGSADIRAVLESRQVVHGALLVVHTRDRDDDQPARVAFIAGRKVGGAVIRNRAKRRLRGALETVPLAPGKDYVLVARRALVHAPGTAVRAELRELCPRDGQEVSQ